MSKSWKVVQQICQEFKKAYFKQKALEKKLGKPKAADKYVLDPFTGLSCEGDQVPNLIPHIPGIQ